MITKFTFYRFGILFTALFGLLAVVSAAQATDDLKAIGLTQDVTYDQPPSELTVGDETVILVEAKPGSPSIELDGYGIYSPPSVPPPDDPYCRITDEQGQPVGFYPQCLQAANNVTYMVLLTAVSSAPQLWNHSLYCIYGQIFGGGGLGSDEVIQTAGGNDNETFNGACVAGGLGAAAGSISATVRDVPFKTPKRGTIAKIGLEVGIGPFTTPTWGCRADVDGTSQWLYFGCSSSGVFNAFAFGSAIAFMF